MKKSFGVIAFAASLAAAGSALALDRAGVDAVRDKATTVLEEQGLEAGIKYLADPANGMIDIDGPGLHTWAVSRKGVIVFDHSGQTVPGMDLSDLVTQSGDPLIKKNFEYADKPGGGGYDDGSWPHPKTSNISNSYLSCKKPKFDPDMAVCAMAWID